ncbi:MAG: universal stress protein [bacterium]|nr:universal stress protein [bacterium]
MYNRLLVAYDGSENSLMAFHEAINIAKTQGKSKKPEIFVVSVILEFDIPHAQESESLVVYFGKYYREKHNYLLEFSKNEGLEIKTHILVGDPSKKIIDFAKENDVELIVITKTSKTKVQQWLMGSVTKRILEYSNCSVLLVDKQSAEKKKVKKHKNRETKDIESKENVLKNK